MAERVQTSRLGSTPLLYCRFQPECGGTEPGNLGGEPLGQRDWLAPPVATGADDNAGGAAGGDCPCLTPAAVGSGGPRHGASGRGVVCRLCVRQAPGWQCVGELADGLYGRLIRPAAWEAAETGSPRPTRRRQENEQSRPPG